MALNNNILLLLLPMKNTALSAHCILLQCKAFSMLLDSDCVIAIVDSVLCRNVWSDVFRDGGAVHCGMQ